VAGVLDEEGNMCLVLYMATRDSESPRDSVDLVVEDVSSDASVRQWFSLPVVSCIGAYTGCGCGFPHVSADEPIEYFDGMFNDDTRGDGVRSVRALLDLVRRHVVAAGEVQLYPVWNGEEGHPPKGAITFDLDTLTPETFFFNERFVYRIGKAGAR
jgi:hypothetical protein